MDLLTIGKRLRQRRQKLGWSAIYVSSLSGVDPSFLSRVERGKTSVSVTTLLKITGALGLSLDAISRKGTGNVTDAVPDYRRIPVLDYVQAGTWRVVSEAMKDDWEKETIAINLDCPPSTFALRIQGDSMEPRFMPGDLVVIDPTVSPKPGEFVVATDEHGEATFKKYKSKGVNAEGVPAFELHPLNSDYEVLYSDRQQITIVGVMLEHRSRKRT